MYCLGDQIADIDKINPADSGYKGETRIRHSGIKLSARPNLQVSLVIVVAVLMAYWQVRNNDFINFDDDYVVFENEHITKGLTRESLNWAFSFNKRSYYQPLAWVSHILDCEIYGLAPGMHHVTSLLLHIVNSLLLFVVLRRMTGDVWKSAFAALLFALHPINVDSVAWIAQRKSVLSTFFWIMTMLAYIYYVKKPGICRYGAVFTAYGLGLLTKPILVTLPFALLLLDFWPLKRFRESAGTGENNWKRICLILSARRPIVYKVIAEKIPLMVLALLFTGLIWIHIESHGVVTSTELVPMKLRIANAPVAYIKYIAKLVFPANLSVYYPYPDKLPLWQSAGAVLILAGLTFLFFFMTGKRYLVTGWLWFLGTLLPVLGLTQIGPWPAMADRWAYVPFMGLFTLIAWGVPDWTRKINIRQKWMAAVAVLILLILISATRRQVQYWADSISLFGHAVELNPQNYKARKQLGAALLEVGRIKEGITQIEAAVELRPDDYDLQHKLGRTYMILGETDKASAQWEKALSLEPDAVRTRYALGMAYMLKGENDKALEEFMKIVNLNPECAGCGYNIARIYAGRNMIEKSAFWLKKAADAGFSNWKLVESDKKMENARRLMNEMSDDKASPYTK